MKNTTKILMVIATTTLLWSCQPDHQVSPNSSQNRKSLQSSMSVFDQKVIEYNAGGLVQLDTADFSLPVGFETVKKYAVFRDPNDSEKAIMLLDYSDNPMTAGCTKNYSESTTSDGKKIIDCDGEGNTCDYAVSMDMRDGKCVVVGITLVVC